MKHEQLTQDGDASSMLHVTSTYEFGINTSRDQREIFTWNRHDFKTKLHIIQTRFLRRRATWFKKMQCSKDAKQANNESLATAWLECSLSSLNIVIFIMRVMSSSPCILMLLWKRCSAPTSRPKIAKITYLKERNTKIRLQNLINSNPRDGRNSKIGSSTESDITTKTH